MATKPSQLMRPLSYEHHAGHIDWARAWAQPVYSGLRVLAWLDRRGGRVRLCDEAGAAVKVPCLEAALAACLTADVVLDGVLQADGGGGRATAAAFKKPGVVLHVWDKVSAEDFGARYTDLFGLVGVGRHEGLRLAKTVTVRSYEEVRVCQREFLRGGAGGAVLRHGKGGYAAGRASGALLRVPDFEEEVFEVVDVKSRAGAALLVCATPAGGHFEVAPPPGHASLLDHWRDYLRRRLGVRYAAMTADGPLLPVATHFVGK